MMCCQITDYNFISLVGVTAKETQATSIGETEEEKQGTCIRLRLFL